MINLPTSDNVSIMSCDDKRGQLLSIFVISVNALWGQFGKISGGYYHIQKVTLFFSCTIKLSSFEYILGFWKSDEEVCQS